MAMVTPEKFEKPEPVKATEALRRPAAFRVSLTMMRQVIDHLASALPDEGCGLLAVPAAGDGASEAVKFYPGTNADRSPARYTMEPAEVLAAFKEMRSQEWQLGAVVHSHPDSEARPSPTDLKEANYPDALMLIVSFAGPTPEARAWSVSGEGSEQQVVECALVIG